MKISNWKTILVVVLLICASISPSFADNNSAEYENEKLVLIQHLFSCQSIIKNTIDLADNATQLKFFYLGLGSEFYETAEESFEKLKGLDSEMDKKLIKNVSSLLKMYKETFSKAETLTKVEMTSGLVYNSLMLQKITKLLYEDPK